MRFSFEQEGMTRKPHVHELIFLAASVEIVQPLEDWHSKFFGFLPRLGTIRAIIKIRTYAPNEDRIRVFEFQADPSHAFPARLGTLHDQEVTIDDRKHIEALRKHKIPLVDVDGRAYPHI